MTTADEDGFFAVELYLDQAAEDAVLHLRAMIADRIGRPLPSGRPHLTIGAGGDARMRHEAAALRAMGDAVAGEPIQFTSLGLFAGERFVVFLAPVVTEALLALHRRMDARLQEVSFDLAGLYRPGRWVPHCTVAAGLSRDELAAAIDVATTFPLPLIARILAIEVRIYPTAVFRDPT